MLKSQTSKPALFIGKGDELSLSGPALTELLLAVLDKGLPFRFRAKGFSMTPFIRDGDVITISPLFGIPPRHGDVVVFIRPGTERVVVHRVVGKKGDSYLIKGDNTFEADGFIPKSNILGSVKKVERQGKAVRLGIGPERLLLAFLTRRGRPNSLLLPVWKLVRPIIKWSRCE